MKIESLPTDVRCYLRSGVAITSVTQCIEELVLNSLDAGATCVAVRVDLTCFKIQVVDNGSGVPRDQLDVLGNRFCTSKCHALADLDDLCHFGYRGEALASIRDSCGILEITTRSRLSNKTYCKIFQNGKSLKVAESTIVRPSVGTTITIHELFTNFPVRQKSMNKNYEMERMKEMLEGIALIRSGISFSLRNDSTGQVILSTKKCSSINSTFGQLYGSAKSDMLAEVRGSKQVFSVQGYIGREGHQRKNLQFVYVNGRLVKKSKIHKSLKKMLLSLPALKPKPRISSGTPQIPFNKQSVFVSPPKFSEVYPIYILEVKCPLSEYDITFEPAKTMVEFKDWDSLLACIDEVTKSFLSAENIAIKTDEAGSCCSKIAEETDEQNVPVISTDTMKDVLVSKTAKRLPVHKSIVTVFQTPDGRNSTSTKPVFRTQKQPEEENMFKTPTDMRIKVSKDAIGLGNRKVQVETDTEDSATAEITEITKSDNASISDYSTSVDCTTSSGDSFTRDSEKSKTIKQTCKGDNANKTSHVPDVVKQSVADNGDGSEKTTGNVSQCSLSRYRQSIGKFTGRQTKSINIDDSLKKLDKIMPSTSKPNSRTWFSSLQRFRRKIETGPAETNINLDSNNEKDLSMNKYVEHENAQNIETEDRFSGNLLSESCTYKVIKDDKENKSRSSAEQNEDNFKTMTGVSLNACNQTRLRDEERSKMTYSSAENEHNLTRRNISEKSNSSKENDGEFKFFPCYDISENVNGLRDTQESDVNENRSAENKQFFDTGNNHFEGKMDSSDEFAIQRSRYNRKRQIHESEDLCGYGKHFKYTARPLGPAELTTELEFKPDVCDKDSVCNKMICDEIDESPKDNNILQNVSDMYSCDRVVDVTKGVVSEEIKIDTDTVESCEKQFDTEIVNEKHDYVTNNGQTDKMSTDMKNESSENETGKYGESTQVFSPRLSPEFIENDKTAKMIADEANTRSPESLGFTPKLQTELLMNTPGSTGFIPDKDIEYTENAFKSDNIEEEKCEVIGVNEDTEPNKKICHNFISDNKEDSSKDISEIHEKKTVPCSVDKSVLEGNENESVTLTQLLKTPSQKVDDSYTESMETETATQNEGVGRKGFSFADLFSQTPCSMNTETVASEVAVNVGDRTEIIDSPGNCSDCNIGMRENVESSSRTCTIKGDNLAGVVDVNEEKPDCASYQKAVDTNDEILWTDSPWDISESSFNLKDKINSDRPVSSENAEQNVVGNDCQGGIENDNSTCTIGDGDDIMKANGDSGTFNVQDMNTLDNLDMWYKRLDADVSVPSDILQSRKPSDVVKRLHACRFSKESLKSVKVLGQLDKKFIACLINTEEQSTETDHTMMVVIDQHAAHERIRLEILTEDAFQHGVKGGQLAPFVVDPPHLMTFAENEVRTILSFKDGYLKLGIALRQDTPTTVLISSIPACLIDKEKNNKIYWNTVQVLIREHIAVFMSTQISHGILPQTIHKVLCSLACHGAIKFGDRLSADECARLIKDLSRCDLPFQCAHGRPSVMPLFHMDKLQSLSHSKHQSKPNLWKLKQAVKLKQKVQH